MIDVFSTDMTDFFRFFSRTGAGVDRDNPQVEIFKSFRVSIEDPCKVVLPVVCLIWSLLSFSDCLALSSPEPIPLSLSESLIGTRWCQSFYRDGGQG